MESETQFMVMNLRVRWLLVNVQELNGRRQCDTRKVESGIWTFKHPFHIPTPTDLER
jgi:hypothetical protein